MLARTKLPLYMSDDKLNLCRTQCGLVKSNYLTSFIIIFCMVFSASVVTYIHAHEHGHLDFNTSHTIVDTAVNADPETEHHHHLHIVGDLVSPISLTMQFINETFQIEPTYRLVFRTYSPPIPPPTA